MSAPPGGVHDGRPDRSLVLRAQDGDIEAFESLIDRYQGRLFRTAYLILGDRQESEDVVQETLLLAWKRLHLIEEPAAVGGWFARICSRRALDVARRHGRRATRSDPGELFEARRDDRPGSDPARAVTVRAETDALARVLGTMSPELRSCWTLREVDDMSYREIADTLGLTESAVRGRLARARAHVISQMEQWR